MTTQRVQLETDPHPQADDRLAFPVDFVWGAATAAYQVEGAVRAHGRGQSIWDTFSHAPGRVLGGDTGDVAVDHYHLYRDDVSLMAELGLTGYRFSIAWPRVQPRGRGQLNRRGLDFYSRLVDELLAAGIEPWPTLYHWDLPQELEDLGGWPNRDVANCFADYAMVVHGELGDRVRHWTTINEPWCTAFLGYASGEHAPGRQEPAASIQAAHHLLLAHGMAAVALRQQRPTTKVGLAVNLYPVTPATATDADFDAARRIDGLQNRVFLDPLLRGNYPVDVVDDLRHITDFGHVYDGDLALISNRPDQLGINYYTRHTVSGQPGSAAPAKSSPSTTGSPWPGSEHVRFVDAGRPVTDMGWEIEPPGLVEVLRRVHEEYPLVPLYVTENGAAFADELTAEEQVHDYERISYLDGHLRACHSVIDAGVPLQGYFAWSLLDNFEWAWGYSKRFGLVYVDYATQRRIPKDSARWYSGVIRDGGLPAPA